MTGIFGGAQSVPTTQNTAQGVEQNTAQQQQFNQAQTSVPSAPTQAIGGVLANNMTFMGRDDWMPVQRRAVAPLTGEQFHSINANYFAGLGQEPLIAQGRGYIDEGADFTREGADFTRQGTGVIGQGADIMRGAADPITGGDINSFYNPFASNITANLENIFGQQNLANRIGTTAKTGGVGADRAAISGALLGKQQTLGAGQIYADLYQRALQAAQQQKAQQLGAGQGVAGAGAGIVGAGGQMSGIGQQMFGAGQGAMQAGFGGLNLAKEMADIPWQLNQANADSDYMFAKERNEDMYRRLGALTGSMPALASAYPGATVGSATGNQTGQMVGSQLGSGTSTTTTPAPSPFSQIAGLAGAGAGLAGLLSDRRLKTDIRKVGMADGGVPLYSFRYKGDPKTYPKVVGPMAQDLAKVYPGAVKEMGRARGGRADPLFGMRRAPSRGDIMRMAMERGRQEERSERSRSKVDPWAAKEQALKSFGLLRPEAVRPVSGGPLPNAPQSGRVEFPAMSGGYRFGGAVRPRRYADGGEVFGEEEELPFDAGEAMSKLGGLGQMPGIGRMPMPMPRSRPPEAPTAAPVEGAGFTPRRALPGPQGPPQGGGGGGMPRSVAMALLSGGLGTLAASGQRDARGLHLPPLAAIGKGGLAGINTYQDEEAMNLKRGVVAENQRFKQLQYEALQDERAARREDRQQLRQDRQQQKILAPRVIGRDKWDYPIYGLPNPETGKWEPTEYNPKGFVPGGEEGQEPPAGSVAANEQRGSIEEETARLVAEGASPKEARRIATRRISSIRTLPAGVQKEMGAMGKTFEQIQNLKGGFKDEYTTSGPAFVGDAKNYAARQLGIGNKDAANYWQDKQALTNEVRHGLFGAALTANETTQWMRQDINPGMTPEAIRHNLSRQDRIARGAMKRKAESLIEQGYSKKAIEKQLGITMDDLPDPITDKDDMRTFADMEEGKKTGPKTGDGPKIGERKQFRTKTGGAAWGVWNGTKWSLE